MIYQAQATMISCCVVLSNVIILECDKATVFLFIKSLLYKKLSKRIPDGIPLLVQ